MLIKEKKINIFANSFLTKLGMNKKRQQISFKTFSKV